MLWPRRRQRRSAGFSLIELLIAVAIIMIIMAVALPNLGILRKNTNSTAAELNLKTLDTTLNAYATEYPNVGYPPSLKALGPPPSGTPTSSAASQLVDAAMANAATAPKQGYLYTYTPAPGTPCSGFTITAVPQNGAGSRYFFMDQDGSLHFSDNSAATAASPIIQ
ncbi:MAG: prepilin-type N-terminal cleavage/methylation domain-containing protein [Terriglobales bacterium]